MALHGPILIVWVLRYGQTDKKGRGKEKNKGEFVVYSSESTRRTGLENN